MFFKIIIHETLDQYNLNEKSLNRKLQINKMSLSNFDNKIDIRNNEYDALTSYLL